MEAIGVFSSCVTALIKLSCCSLRRISRTKKLVLTISPAISTAKRMTPKNSITSWRQLRIIQLTFSAIASITRHTPSTTKNTMALLRLVMRMGRSQNNSTSVGVREKTGRSCCVGCFRQIEADALQTGQDDIPHPPRPKAGQDDIFKAQGIAGTMLVARNSGPRNQVQLGIRFRGECGSWRKLRQFH